MKNALILVLALLTVIGCTSLPMAENCLDAKFEREPQPINGIHSITIKTNKDTHKLNIECEKYYNADCSTRGNYWDVRAKGAEYGTYVAILDYEVQDNYVARIQLPYCKQLWARKLDLEMLRVLIGNQLYKYHSSDENNHIFINPKERTSYPREINLYLDIKYEFIDNSG